MGSGDLRENVILIVGASSGMGRSTAIAAAGAGAQVVLAARDASALDAVRAAIAARGLEALVVPTDATDAAAVGKLVDDTVAAFGRIDVAVNTVGTNIPRRALSELTGESWAMMVETNLSAAFHLTQAVVPVMRGQGDGLIVHVSSSAARKPDASGVAYQATKAGVLALAHGTMVEERHNGIRTSVILPGMTDTPLVLKRPQPTPPEILAQALQPEDVAAAIMFVMQLPARAHVPELLLYPSTL